VEGWISANGYALFSHKPDTAAAAAAVSGYAPSINSYKNKKERKWGSLSIQHLLKSDLSLILS
jgi:hypothetical protein